MIPRIKNNARWGFVSGRISVLEGRLVSREFFLNFIAQEHLGDVVQHLQDTLVREYLTPGTVWADFSELCDRFFQEMVCSLRADSPSTLPADIYLLKYDYLNLKTALHGASDFAFPFGSLSLETLLAISHGDQSQLPAAARESETVGEAGVETDVRLDAAYLRELLSIALQLRSELITAYIRDRVLSFLVMILWRAFRQQTSLRRYQQGLVPMGDFTPIVMELANAANPEGWPSLVGGVVGEILSESLNLPKGEQISGFNLKVSNYLTRLARDGKYQTAGPERVFAFLAGLQAEVQNLKLVVNGRQNRVDRGVLRQRLREGYV
jgi:V/A-type H+/Na+-transporting ATPase subunit C